MPINNQSYQNITEAAYNVMSGRNTSNHEPEQISEEMMMGMNKRKRPMGGMPPMGGMKPPAGGMPKMGGMKPPAGGMPKMGGMKPPMGGMKPPAAGVPPMGGMKPPAGMPKMGGMPPMGGMKPPAGMPKMGGGMEQGMGMKPQMPGMGAMGGMQQPAPAPEMPSMSDQPQVKQKLQNIVPFDPNKKKKGMMGMGVEGEAMPKMNNKKFKLDIPGHEDRGDGMKYDKKGNLKGSRGIEGEAMSAYQGARAGRQMFKTQARRGY